MGCAEIYLRVTSAIGFVAMVLCVSSYCYVASSISYKSLKVRFGYSVKKQNVFINQHWYMSMSILLFAFVSIGFCVYELLLIINPAFFRYKKSALIRVIVYVVLGITVLGMSADLGIAAGFITLIVAVWTLVNWLIIVMGCLKPEQPQQAKSFD